MRLQDPDGQAVTSQSTRHQNKKQKTAVLIEIVVQSDSNIIKEYEKLEKLQGLKEKLVPSGGGSTEGCDLSWESVFNSSKNNIRPFCPEECSAKES